jgi:two-component system nitrogen regulation response regulator NtrX
MSGTVLVVDDEPIIIQTLEGVLSDEGFSIQTAGDGISALTSLEELVPDLILLDIWMPGLDGLETLEKIKKEYPALPVIMMSGAGTIETAVKATKLGAFDYIEKPLSLEKVLVVLNNALEVSRLHKENLLLKENSSIYNLDGVSDSIAEARRKIELVAPTDASVLITGENGTGKEVAANMIHHSSTRAKNPMIAVNCAAIPEELIESELFGYEKGAFTGAQSRKRGKFDLANNSTIFLDEIADMSLKTQAKILRILQEQSFERVGGSKTISVNVRVIAATNRKLDEEIKSGRFREDLFYRLNVVPIVMPPLRNRREDITDLANFFLERYSKRIGGHQKTLSEEAIEALKAYHWPGNVRELKNLMERLIILCPDNEISEIDLPVSVHDKSLKQTETEMIPNLKNLTLKEARIEFEKIIIEDRLKVNQGNVSATAENLGIERSYLHKKIKSLGIKC